MRTHFVHAFVLLLAILLVSCGALPAANVATPTPPPATAVKPPTPTPPPTATRAVVAVATKTVVPTSAAVNTAPPTATEQPTAVPTEKPTEEPTEPPAPTAIPITPLSDLPNLDGQEVTVQGAVIWAASLSTESSGAFKFILDDGTGRATLMMWLDTYDECWDADKLLVGATVRATGEVSQYNGEWELTPGFGGDVKVLSEGTPLSVRAISSITSADVSTRVAIEGTVSRVEAFSKGQSVYVDDGSGSTIRVVMWQVVLDRVKDNARLLTPGTRVHIEGAVDEYKGALELVPQVPYNVTVLP